jgi:hypothetical protein
MTRETGQVFENLTGLTVLLTNLLICCIIAAR